MTITPRHDREETAVKSTMQDAQLTVASVLRHGTTVHRDSEVVTATPDGTRRRSYAEVGRRSAQLAHALRDLGVDLVGACCGSTPAHIAAMGRALSA